MLRRYPPLSPACPLVDHPRSCVITDQHQSTPFERSFRISCIVCEIFWHFRAAQRDWMSLSHREGTHASSGPFLNLRPQPYTSCCHCEYVIGTTGSCSQPTPWKGAPQALDQAAGQCTGFYTEFHITHQGTAFCPRSRSSTSFRFCFPLQALPGHLCQHILERPASGHFSLAHPRHLTLYTLRNWSMDVCTSRSFLRLTTYSTHSSGFTARVSFHDQRAEKQTIHPLRYASVS